MPLYLDFKPNPKDVTLQPEGYYATTIASVLDMCEKELG